MVEILGVTLAWPVLLKLGAAVLAVIAGSVIAATWVERALGTWARRRGLGPDGAHVLRVRRFVLPVLLIGALHATLGSLDLPRNLRAVLGRILGVANLTLTLYLIAQLSLALLARLTARSEAGRRVGTQMMTMARATFAVVFGALLLDNLGIHLTALVTTLGIGSLAVALALQDTLANFFAGLHLLADRPVRPGDYIKLIEGAEGFVETIGWRSSRLRTTANNTVVVPNQKLSQAILTNFHLPIANVTMTVTLTVAADVDADAVEKALTEELARAVAEIADLH